MKIDEAFKMMIANPQLWGRPLNWRESGRGVFLVGDVRLVIVPNPRGSYGPGFIPNYKDVVDEWEVVDPDVILDEVIPSNW